MLQAFRLYVLSAYDAVAKLTVIYSINGSLYAFKLQTAAPLGLDVHGLDLKGIHAGQATNNGLV